MTVTQIAPRATEPTQPLQVVPAPRPSAPMNSTVMAHIHADTEITAIRRTQDSSLELAVGSSSAGTQVVLFLRDDADVIRLIDALQSVYASAK